MDIKIDTPDQQALTVQAEKTLEIAKEYRIDGPEMYQAAGGELQQIKGKMRQLDDMRKAITRPIDEAKSKVMDMFRAPLEILASAEGVLKKALIAYDAEQERKRREEEARLRELARKEQERLQAEARKAEETAARKAEELRKQAEAEAAAGNAAKAEQLQAKAEVVMEKAEDKAAALQMSAQAIPMPIVQAEQPKVAGISKRTIWRARVTDVNKVPREYMMANEQALDAVAKATKGAIQIPGVEFYPEVSMAAGRR